MEIGKLNSAVAPIPFLGDRAQFAHKDGDWAIETIPSFNRIRHLEFESKTKGSFLTQFTVNGYDDGSVALHVNFDPSYGREIEEYLTKMRFSTRYCMAGFCHERDPTSMQRLFTTILENNTVPPKYIGLIQSLVKSGNWREVTWKLPD